MLNHALSIISKKTVYALLAATLALGALGTGCVAEADEIDNDTVNDTGLKVTRGGFVSPGDLQQPRDKTDGAATAVSFKGSELPGDRTAPPAPDPTGIIPAPDRTVPLPVAPLPPAVPLPAPEKHGGVVAPGDLAPTGGESLAAPTSSLDDEPTDEPGIGFPFGGGGINEPIGGSTKP